MKEFEYLVSTENGLKELYPNEFRNNNLNIEEEKTLLNKLGEIGWELITIKQWTVRDKQETWYYFKREKEKEKSKKQYKIPELFEKI